MCSACASDCWVDDYPTRRDMSPKDAEFLRWDEEAARRAVLRPCQAHERLNCWACAFDRHVADTNGARPLRREEAAMPEVPLVGIVDDLPNHVYHGDTTHLSSSTLKRLLPEHYGPPPTDPNALDVGSVFHARVFGTGEAIEVVDAATWRSKAAEAERARIKADGALPILADDSAMVDAMVARVRSHPLATRLLNQDGARAEVSAFTVDDDGLPIKARYDLLAPVAVDLKSTSADPFDEQALARAVVSYGYDLSAAHYLEVAQRLDLGVVDFALLFVGKKPPHPVRVVALDDAFLARGRDLVALAKHRHRYGVPEHVGTETHLTLSPPRWARHPEGIPA